MFDRLFWYIFILSIIFVLSLMAFMAERRKVNINSFTIPAASSLLLFFMAFRSIWTGADTKQYVAVFRQICLIPINKVFTTRIYAYSGTWRLNLEKGYLLFNKLVSYLSHHDQAITIASSVVLILLLVRLVKKRSIYPLLSLWLYLTLGIYQTNMNMMRNAIVIFWCYNCFQFVEEERLPEYLLCILLATFFHKSAILFIPFYWIFNKVEFTPQLLRRLLVVAIVLGLGVNLIRPFLLRTLPVRFARYFRGDTSDLEGLLVGLFHLILIAIIFVITKRRKWHDMVALEQIGIWMLIAEVFFYAIGFNVAYGTRMAALFGPFIIILIPNLIGKGYQTNENKMLTVAFVMAITGAQYIVRLMINNIGITIPYRFFWS